MIRNTKQAATAKRKNALKEAFNRQVGGLLLGGKVSAPKSKAQGESEAVGKNAKNMKKV